MPSRFTFAETGPVNGAAVWSPDGTRIAWLGRQSVGGAPTFFHKLASGTGKDEKLRQIEGPWVIDDWVGDQGLLFHDGGNPPRTPGLRILPVSGGEPRTLGDARSILTHARARHRSRSGRAVFHADGGRRHADAINLASIRCDAGRSPIPDQRTCATAADAGLATNNRRRELGSGLEEMTLTPGGRGHRTSVRRTARTFVVKVATCSYTYVVTSTGIRELKDNLSRFIRRIEAGERVTVTAHGRVVAELVPPAKGSRGSRASRYEELIATGVIRPALETGDPLEGWPDIRLPPGTAAELIDADRGET